MDFDKFYKYIELLDDNTSIGIHAIMKDKEDTTDLSTIDIGKAIMEEGLRLYNWDGILNTVKMYGRVCDLSRTNLKKIYNHIVNLGKTEELALLLFGFPEEITNSENEKFYLGYYNDEAYEYFKNYKKTGCNLPLNHLCERIQFIPKEFIIGCITKKKDDQEIKFTVNKQYHEFNNDQKFYDNLYNALRDKNVVNIADWYDNLGLLAQYNLDFNLILQQYGDYINNKGKTKTKKNSYN